MEEDSYTTGQAARILKVTDRGVRKMIDRGELEARQDDRDRHLILKRAVHAMLEERRSTIPSGAIESGGPVCNRRGLLAYLIVQTHEERMRTEEAKGKAEGRRRTKSERRGVSVWAC